VRGLVALSAASFISELLTNVYTSRYLGYFYDSLTGDLVITDLDQFTKHHQEGDSILFEGIIFTLKEGKWVGKDPWGSHCTIVTDPGSGKAIAVCNMV
jgi:hypothetical protein